MTPGRRTSGASESSSGQPMRPTSCRAATAAIARPCSTRSHAAPGISKAARTRPRPGSIESPPGAAWSPPALLVQGGVPRVARGEAGLARALASAQFDDGGLDQPFAVRAGASWSTGSVCCAPATRRRSRPFPTGSKPRRRRRWRRFMESRWATARCRAGRVAVQASRRGSRHWSKAAAFAPGRFASRAGGAIIACRPSVRSSSSTPRRRRSKSSPNRDPPRRSPSNFRTGPSAWW